MRYAVLIILILAMASCRTSRYMERHTTATEQRTEVSDSVCKETQTADTQRTSTFIAENAEVVLEADSAVMPDGTKVHGVRAKVSIQAPQSQTTQATAIAAERITATADSVAVLTAADEDASTREKASALATTEWVLLLTVVGVALFTFYTFRKS